MKNYTQRGKSIILKNQEDFQLEHIFDCGQCFRWRQDGSNQYIGVAYGNLLIVEKKNNDIYFTGTTEKEFLDVWHRYFDLDTNYTAIKDKLSKGDDVMKEATAFGNGIRILRQEPWETIVSFIISANNNIPRIKKSIQLLCQSYGTKIGSYMDEDFYSFPEPEALMNLKAEDLSACNMGYRGPYIIKTAQRIYENPQLLSCLYDEDTLNCKKKLLELMGVGPKVANCISFFAFGKLDSFPVDVWIKRLMEYFYFHREMKEKDIEAFAKDKYGDLAGYAQQYLFYYGREMDIGKGD